MRDEIAGLFPQFINDITLLQRVFNLRDLVWRFPAQFGPDPQDWTMVNVILYENTYYCYWTEWDYLEILFQ